MNDVDRLSRDELNVSRRELMSGSAVVAGAAVLGAMPRKVEAQDGPTMEISGTVTDAQGAVENATVVAVPHDESLDPLVTTTDANGDYIFDNGDLHDGENLYHVIARDGTEADPRRGQQNYPFIAATGGPDIPDSGSLQARWTAKDLSLSDGQTVDPWPDATGNGHDLTAGTAPTYQASAINSNPAVRHDGADDLLTVDWSSVSQPFHVFFVGIDLSGVDDAQTTFFDGGSASEARFFGHNDSNNNVWQGFAGNGLGGGQEDADIHIFTILFNGASSHIRVDGTQIASGDIGSNSLTGFTTGAERGGALFGNVDLGEILVYFNDVSSNESDIENYLDNEWGPIL